MSILPLQLLTPVTQVGRVAGTAAAAAGAGFSSLLKIALQNSSVGNAGEKSTGSASPVAPGSAGLNVDALKKETDDLLGALHRQLVQLLASNGVDVSGGVHLQLDDFNQLRVAGSPAGKREIETLLASHPELEEMFQSVAARELVLKELEARGQGLPSDPSPKQVDLYFDLNRTEVSFMPGGGV